ncbi:50S ribosomal protein L29 [Rubricoccus marinus]|uniref:Large ribosomal subunit protein uL29 n=1 Tax=Rubricoccus marinus TaxID=716817 RepID=A0A259U141_9BACT|nr:50S ribosomal protein L29 [Rubricoccus marinus]OZC03719.1 50S ribosomal protein L29 [Rubricoccus marinus]
MKAKDIREMNSSEIEERIAENRQDITELRFRRVVAGLEDPVILREKRREIARLKTILNEKKKADA